MEEYTTEFLQCVVLDYHDDGQVPEDKALIPVQVHTTGFVSDGKYEYNETVYEILGRFFEVFDSRTGSYYSDYHYLDAECYEVCPEIKMITVYNRI